MADLTGKEKALIFLSTLGDEVSRKVLSCLPDKISQRISNELNSFPKPSPDAVAFVFKELNKIALTARTESPRLSGPVEPEAEIEHLDSLSHLGRKNPRELVSILQEESAQTVAFILSYLTPSRQTNFLELLSPGRRNEVKQQKVERVPISNQIFERINEQLLVLTQ